MLFGGCWIGRMCIHPFQLVLSYCGVLDTGSCGSIHVASAATQKLSGQFCISNQSLWHSIRLSKCKSIKVTYLCLRTHQKYRTAERINVVSATWQQYCESITQLRFSVMQVFPEQWLLASLQSLLMMAIICHLVTGRYGIVEGLDNPYIV